ncbi:MAG: hypothetical protein ACAH80_16240 [Alphaproteobacteria bacterium]
MSDKKEVDQAGLAMIATSWLEADSPEDVTEYFKMLRKDARNIYIPALDAIDAFLADIFLPPLPPGAPADARAETREFAQLLFQKLYSGSAPLGAEEQKMLGTISKAISVLTDVRDGLTHQVLRAYAKEAGKLSDAEYDDPAKLAEIGRAVHEGFKSWQHETHEPKPPKPPANPFRNLKP